jgi:hypothetical protein
MNSSETSASSAIKRAPPNASLTFANARDTCPPGWKHILEVVFQAAVMTGIPFTIYEIRNDAGQLRFDIEFSRKDLSSSGQHILDRAFKFILLQERESYYTCEECGAYSVRWAFEKKIISLCRACSGDLLKGGAYIVDSAPWERGKEWSRARTYGI